MKTRSKSLAFFSILLLFFVAGMQATYAFTITQEAPLATITSGGSHPLIFSGTVFTKYGTESDNQYGQDQFSLQLNGYYTTWCGGCHPSSWVITNFQPSLGYEGNNFLFYPQIWSTFIAYGQQVWHGAGVRSPIITTSQLTGYEIFQGVNAGSTSQTVIVSSCNTSITVPSSSMYAGILQLSNCFLVWHSTQSFPTNFDTGFQSMQTGALGLQTSSKASFTGTVLYSEDFELNCAYSGCTYSFSNPNGQASYTSETSNLTYVTNPDTGGYHVNECQESPDENVC
ncbi:MAG TPA: hypothetical protein VGR53_10940 [Nitrososphaerales archaeon]|nr:hypothetical protein [Nitrososphaerales archaeon]